MADDGAPPTGPPERKRLVLKPRDPEAAAKLAEEQRQKAASAKVGDGGGGARWRCTRMLGRHPGAGNHARGWGAEGCLSGAPRDAGVAPSPPRAQNPFGAAKPREAIIAARSGKTEEEVRRGGQAEGAPARRSRSLERRRVRSRVCALPSLQVLKEEVQKDKLHVSAAAGRAAARGERSQCVLACARRVAGWGARSPAHAHPPTPPHSRTLVPAAAPDARAGRGKEGCSGVGERGRGAAGRCGRGGRG